MHGFQYTAENVADALSQLIELDSDDHEQPPRRQRKRDQPPRRPMELLEQLAAEAGESELFNQYAERLDSGQITMTFAKFKELFQSFSEDQMTTSTSTLRAEYDANPHLAEQMSFDEYQQSRLTDLTGIQMGASSSDESTEPKKTPSLVDPTVPFGIGSDQFCSEPAK